MPKKKTKQEQLVSLINDWRIMANKYSVRAAKQLNKIARLEVWKWYKSYTPYEYTRKRTLYYAFKITGENGIINIHFGPELMYPVHRVDKRDPSYIYENSFVLGFHGGAIDGPDHPQPGIPYWRTPAPDYPFWSYKAAHHTSPIDRINKAIDDYEIKLRNQITNEFKQKLYPKLIQVLKG